MKKIFILLITLFVFHVDTYSQQYYSVIFNEIPQDFQFFPRNEQNLATLPASGVIELPDWSYMSAVVTRENVKWGYSRTNIVYKNNSTIGTFSFKSITIKAEAAEYECAFYACKGKDSVLMTSRQHLVAGDFYVINGQSNATAFGVGNVPYLYTNKYIRTFGQFSNGINPQRQDTLWAAPDQRAPYVGAWGLHIQRLIIENHGIPTCFISGAVPGSFISNHLQRLENDPGSIETLYGSLLYRVRKAKAINDIKAFIWFHGEGDILSSSLTYPRDFEQLYNYWKVDYPNVKQFMVFQSNIHSIPSRTGGAIREFQRQTATLFPKIITYAVNGASGFDGAHHTREGYQQIGTEAFRILEPLYYKVKDSPNIHSPNIQKAYFTSKERNAITLEFESGQEMVNVADTTVKGKQSNTDIIKSVKDYFYFDNNENITNTINSITPQNNKVTLRFDKPVTNNTICYLPASYITPEIPSFIGPCLKNKGGMRAFAFYNIKIESESAVSIIPLDAPVLVAKVNYYNETQLNWAKIAKAQNYILERKTANQDYVTIATLDSSKISYIDKSLSAGSLYYYRIKAYNTQTESPYSITDISTPALLSNTLISTKLVAINQIRVNWTAVSNANSYQLDRKIGTENFENIAKYPNSTLEYLDKNVAYGTDYTYRITSYGNLTESLPSVSAISSPKVLDNPTIKATVVNKNAVNIAWKAVSKAKNFIVERKQANGKYAIITQPDSSVLTFSDVKLTENTNYTYRIKAYGTFTESVYDSVSIKTPDFLTSPVLTISESVAQRTLTVKWNAISDANRYLLERQTGSDTTYQKVIDSSNILEFVENQIKQNQKYTYRLKVFNAVSESIYSSINITTSIILGVNIFEKDLLVRIFPNPSKGNMTIIFPETISGNLSLFDLKGAIVYDQTFTKLNQYYLTVNNLKSGVYILKIDSNRGIFIEKIVID